ncbi:PTS sugar transporter subunit IIA [Corticibacter populi]|uniref:PTS sugar transporter subunit IIA n=1 Tax=Corticibacter populi TaxID=1550736 RepID=UPI001F5EE72A|nr:PTS fructose transporter subunit IIA [Corticibacter populi]
MIVAHAPLASALRSCGLHVFADAGDALAALDVRPEQDVQTVLRQAAQQQNELTEKLGQQQARSPLLILADVFGATPANAAQQLLAWYGAQGIPARLLAGANVPMLLRALTYRKLSLDDVAERALSGGVNGVMAVSGQGAQQHRHKTPHDPAQHDHQQ